MKNELFLGCAAVAIASIPGQALAQQSTEGPPQDAQETGPAQSEDEPGERVIIVEGVRAALEESAAIKRNADNFIEVVTAEDIGQLPDTSIAESLERVTGVVATQDRGRATELVVRGLSPELTLTTFNGRELASEQPSRAVQLGLFPSEIISQARVIKSPTADLVENGLAGTVDLRTARPLDQRRRILSANVRAIVSDMPSHDAKPSSGWRGSASYIDKFADDTFGIALSVAYQDDVNLVQDAGIGAEAPPEIAQQYDSARPRGFGDIDGDGTVDFVPRVGLFNNEAIETERFGVVGGIQWRPSDRTEIRLDGMHTSRTDEALQLRLRSIVLPNPNVVFDPASLVFDDAAVGQASTLAGDVIEGSLVRAFQISDFGRIRNDGIYRDFKSDFTSFGLYAEQGVGDWLLSVDLGYSEAKRVNDIVEVTAFRDRIGFRYDDTGAVPSYLDYTVDLLEPQIGPGPAAGFTPEAYAEANNRASDELFQARFDVSREFASDFVEKLSFGVRYFDRQKVLRRDRDGVPRNAVNRPFSATNDSAQDLEVLAAAVRPFPSSNFLGGSAGITGWFYPDPLTVQAQRGGELDLGLDEGDYTRDTHDVDEEAIAGYVQMDFDGYLGDLPVRGNVGLRAVHTKTAARLVTPQFTITTDSDGNLASIDLEPLTEDTVVFETFENSYTNILPSFNLVAQATPELQLRAAIARAMSRPLYDDLGKTLTISGTTPDDLTGELSVIGRSGNPFLNPFLAWQFDLGFGWYPSRDLNIVGTVWYKAVDNFIINSPGEIRLQDSAGVEIPIIVNQPVNEPSSKYIYGVELGYFHNFRFLPGFLSNVGFTANYTYLKTNVETTFVTSYTDGNGATPNGIGCEVPDPTATGRICATVTQPPNGFASHAANAVLFYDDRTFDLRFSARYKSDNPAQFQDFPRVEKGNIYFDLNVGYNISRNVRLLGSVTNVFNQEAERLWDDPFGSGNAVARQLYRKFGRTFTFGVLAKM